MEDEATPKPEFVLDWEKLTAPVPPEDIEYVEKAKGKMFAYMTAQFLRRRLDSVAQGRWSYECEVIPFVEGQPSALDGEPFVVKGTLNMNADSWITRESLGSGKNFKEAETDAFKRAAQRLGIGNELYEMDAVPAGAPPRANPPAGPRATPTAAPVDKPAASAAPLETVHAECPVCTGPMWDNRVDKKNPKAPDWSCKKGFKVCKGAYWTIDDVPEYMRPQLADMPMKDKLDRKTDDLPF